MTSTPGAKTSLSAPFQSSDCGALPFGPKLTAATVGKASRKDGIGFDVKIVEGYAHEANAHYVKVELPKQLPSRLTTLNNACPARTFEANPASCPSNAIVGTANAVTSVLPVALAGPAYFVSHGGAKFPELVIVLQGYGVTIELHGETFIDKAGITSTTYPEVPEAPVASFELRLPAGPDSALTASGSLCGEDLLIPTTIVAYNGLMVKESPQITIGGCPTTIRVLRHTFHRGVLTVVVRVPSAGTLSGTAKGFARKIEKVDKARTTTIKISPAKRSRRSSGHHHNRRTRVLVKLTFTPKHGPRLSTHLLTVVH
jgi:hypothetical protein